MTQDKKYFMHTAEHLRELADVIDCFADIETKDPVSFPIIFVNPPNEQRTVEIIKGLLGEGLKFHITSDAHIGYEFKTSHLRAVVMVSTKHLKREPRKVTYVETYFPALEALVNQGVTEANQVETEPAKLDNPKVRD